MHQWRDEWTEQLTGSSTRMNEYCCLTSAEASRPVRDGDEWEKRGKKSETSRQAPTRKTKAAVDRRQNNKMLKRCSSGIAQRLPYRPNCYAEHLHTTINWYT